MVVNIMVHSEDTFNPTLQELKSEMRCGIISNTDGDVLIIHDLKIKDDIQWVEFVEKDNSLYVVHSNGCIQPLGFTPDKQMIEHFKNCQEVKLVHLVNKKIESTRAVVFLMQQT